MLVTGCRPPVTSAAIERELPPVVRPDVEVTALTDLLVSVGLEWFVAIRPLELTQLDWLRPSIARVLKDERLDALALATGVQLRDVPELVLASYRIKSNDPAIAYVLRHHANPQLLERKFRERLTSDGERREFGHQLLGVWGRVGRALRGFIAIGPHVVSYQYGGERAHGPNRIALLYAEGRLAEVPPVSRNEVLARVDGALGAAPIKAFLLGPFEGPRARGVHGLLASATAVGISLQPSDEKTLRVHIVLDGDYAGEDASRYLEDAWSDLATSDLGHLLGLGSPSSPIRIHAAADRLDLEVELDPTALTNGLAAATSDDVRDIMR